MCFFFFSSRRRHTRCSRDWSSDVCSSDLEGRRIGGEVPKTYLPVCGRPMVLRTLDQFFSAQAIEEVVLVIAADEFLRCETMLRDDSGLANRPWILQSGGPTRQQSVKKGLEKIGSDTDIVVI